MWGLFPRTPPAWPACPGHTLCQCPVVSVAALQSSWTKVTSHTLRLVTISPLGNGIRNTVRIFFTILRLAFLLLFLSLRILTDLLYFGKSLLFNEIYDVGVEKYFLLYIKYFHYAWHILSAKVRLWGMSEEITGDCLLKSQLWITKLKSSNNTKHNLFWKKEKILSSVHKVVVKCKLNIYSFKFITTCDHTTFPFCI